MTAVPVGALEATFKQGSIDVVSLIFRIQSWQLLRQEYSLLCSTKCSMRSGEVVQRLCSGPDMPNGRILLWWSIVDKAKPVHNDDHSDRPANRPSQHDYIFDKVADYEPHDV